MKSKNDLGLSRYTRAFENVAALATSNELPLFQVQQTAKKLRIVTHTSTLICPLFLILIVLRRRILSLKIFNLI